MNENFKLKHFAILSAFFFCMASELCLKSIVQFRNIETTTFPAINVKHHHRNSRKINTSATILDDLPNKNSTHLYAITYYIADRIINKFLCSANTVLFILNNSNVAIADKSRLNGNSY